MLLNEITSTDKIIKAKGLPRIHGKKLGEGLFAEVYEGRKTNTVIKVADLNSPSDAYINFIRDALQNQNNPFFPRIYNAKLYDQDAADPQDAGKRPKSGRVPPGLRGYTLIVEMEKLLPLNHPKIIHALPHTIENILASAGIEIDEFVHRFMNLDIEAEMADDNLTADQIEDQIHQRMTNAAVKAFFQLSDWLTDPEDIQKFIEYTENEQLKQALKALARLFEKHQVDLNVDNMMFRLTSTGPQLVITDPVAF